MAFLPSEVEIDAATSPAVTPAGNSRTLPSGKVREIWLIWPLLVGLAPTERPVAGYNGAHLNLWDQSVKRKDPRQGRYQIDRSAPLCNPGVIGPPSVEIMIRISLVTLVLLSPSLAQAFCYEPPAPACAQGWT